MAGENTLAGGTTTAPVATPPSSAPGGGQSSSGLPPAAGGAPGGTVQPPAAPPSGSVDWLAPFTPEVRSAIELKGLKGLADLGNSWDHASKLVGKVGGATPEQIIILPKDDADLTGRHGVLAKLGAPDKPEGYGFKPTDPKDDPLFANKTAEIAHKWKLPLREAQGFVNDMAQMMGEMSKAQSEAQVAKAQAALQADVETLQKELGEAYPSRIAMMKKVVESLIPETFEGMPRKDVISKLESALGFRGFYKWMQTFAEMFGEARFAGGSKEPGRSQDNAPSTPEAQHAKLQELKNRPGFAAKLLANDPDAKKEWADAMPRG